MSQYSTDFWIYFALGLVLIVVFSHRQFNEPSWQNDSNIIQRLAPSQIIGKSTYYSAYLVYLALIVLVYLFLCFSVKALEVATTLFNLVLSQNPAGGTTGGVVGAGGAGGGDEATRQVNPLQLDRSVPTFPLLVSLAMGALMRVPYVQRVEHWLRGFAHWVFGIPTVQVKLLDRMLRTRVDLPRLEADIAFEDGAETYSRRIERYADAGASVLKSAFSKREFRDRLATIFAFKAWVSEQRIWPGNGLTSDSSAFAPLYANVLDEIAVLEKDLELLSVPALLSDAGEAVLDDKMREELWAHRVREVARVCKDVCSVMALFAPNSDLPDPEAPTAASLIEFLQDCDRGNEAWRIQRDSALIAITLSAAWMAVMGAVFALGLQLAAPDIYAAEPTNAVFDPLINAWQWLLTGVLAYGTATYMGIHRRSALLRRGRWISAFGRRYWPFGQWMMLALRCFLTVVLCYAVYFILGGVLVPLDQLAAMVSQFQGTFWRNVEEILPFGMIAGLHGAMVAILMDLGRRQLADGTSRRLVTIHVTLLAAAGFAIGFYISQVRGVPPAVMYLRLVMHTLASAGVALAAGWSITWSLRRALEIEDDETAAPAPNPAAALAAAHVAAAPVVARAGSEERLAVVR